MRPRLGLHGQLAIGRVAYVGLQCFLLHYSTEPQAFGRCPTSAIMAQQSYDFVIVGAGLAGASAVEGIRERDTRGGILLVGADPQRPYNRPPLSKGLWTGKEKPDAIFVHDVGFYQHHNVDL